MSSLFNPISRTLGTFLALGALTAAFAQSSSDVEYPRSELQTEQRIMRADMDDANYHINRGIQAVKADLPELAKVSMLRATGRVAKVEALMKDYPERIERVAMVFLTPREEVREDLRTSYQKLRDDFGTLEQAMYAFRKDMARKGIFGEELKQQVAVLDAASKLLPELNKKNPELAKSVRSLIEQINDALSNGDNAKAAMLIEKLSGMLASAGYQQNIDQAKKDINDSAGMTSSDESQKGSAARRVSEGGKADGSGSAAQGNAAAGQAATGQVGNTKVTDNGNSFTIYDAATGQSRSIPKSFFHGNQATIYETQYIGGENQKLTAERELKVTLKQDSEGKITGADQTAGRERQWDFAISETPGARKFTDDGSGMVTQLAFRDNKRKTDFKITGWEIKNGAGQVVGSFGTQDKVDYTFKQSGEHTVTVSGETDWGNKFNVSVTIKVAL